MMQGTLWGIAVACLTCLYATAQEPTPVARPDALGLRANPVDVDSDLRRLVEKVMMLELRKAVDLTDDQVEMLVKRIGTFKDRLTRMKFQRGAAREELRLCLDRGLAEEEIRLKLGALLQHEEAIAVQLHAMIDEAAKDLNVSQTTQLYLFVGDFEALMREKILHARYAHLHGTLPARASDPEASREQSLVDELVRRESLGPTGRDPEDEDMVTLFDGVLMTQLARALDLKPEETLLLFERVGTFKDQLHELKWQIAASRELLRMVLEQNVPDATIERHLQDQLLQERAAAELTRMLVTEAQKDVSLAQSARLYLFIGDFEEYVIRLLDRAQRMSVGSQVGQP